MSMINHCIIQVCINLSTDNLTAKHIFSLMSHLIMPILHPLPHYSEQCLFNSNKPQVQTLSSGTWGYYLCTKLFPSVNDSFINILEHSIIGELYDSSQAPLELWGHLRR